MLKIIEWILDGFREVAELKEQRRMERDIDLMSYYSRHRRFPPGSALDRYADYSEKS